MRLHRLLLIDVRGVGHREIELPAAGMVVIEGPNEAGKTTLVEALDLLLEEKDSSGKRRIRDLQPVGRDVGSTVEAELTLGPCRFVYRKTWNRGAATTLAILSPRPEQLTGSAAHERVEELLDEHLDRTLWGALRLLQGIQVEQAGIVGSPALSAALEAAAGAATETGADLSAVIEQEYLRLRTPTGRPTGELVTALTQERHAAHAARIAQAELDEIASETAHHDDLSARCTHLEESVRTRRQEAGEAGDRQRALERLETERSGTAETADRAQADLRRAAADHRARRALLARFTATQDETAGQEARLALQIAAQEITATQLAAAIAAHAEASARHAHAVEDADQARADERELETRERRAAVAERVAWITADQRAMELAESRAQAHRLDAADVADLEGADRAAHLAIARRDAVATELVLERVGAGRIEVDGSTLIGRIGGEERRLVTAELRLDTDAVRVTIRPGSDAADLVAAADRARTRLAELLAVAGQRDLDGARRALAARVHEERELSGIRHRLEGRLGPDSVESLCDDERTLLVTEQGLARSRGARELPATASIAAAHRQAADRGLTAAARTVRSTFIQLERARSAHADGAVEIAGTQARTDAARRSAGQWEFDLGQARLLAPDDRLEDALTVASAAAAVADRAAQADEIAWRAADPVSTRSRAAAAARELTRVEADLTAADEQRREVTARLSVMGEQGRQEALDAARTAHLVARDELTASESRDAAAGLLHRTVQRYRSQVRSRYVEPFRAQLLALARLVQGPELDLEVDEELRIVSRTVAGRTVPFEQLSTGAREQLGLVARLACTRLLGDGGVPLILDDALGHTDPARLRSMGAVFAAAGPASQVILLTSSPDRYAAIPDAQVVRLDDADAVVGDPGPAGTGGAVDAAAVRPLDLAAESSVDWAIGSVRPEPGSSVDDPRLTRVLQVLRAEGSLGRAQLLERAGLTAPEWTAVRRDLLDSGLVRVTGSRRGVRYSA